MNKPKKARLDKDKSAKPLSEIVTHAKQNNCIGPGSPLVNPEYRNSDGIVIKIANDNEELDDSFLDGED